MGIRGLAVALAVAVFILSACGSSKRSAYSSVPEVYAALVSQLESQDKVLHATATLTEPDSQDSSTYEYWIDEARDLAREDERIANVIPRNRGLFIVDGQEYSYVGNTEPQHWDAPSCEGISAPAVSLLLRCEGVAGTRSELIDDGGTRLRVVTTGNYGPDIANKPWSITLTLDANSLLPVSMESDLWALLNGEPYESHETATYTTELIERDSLPADLFDLK